MADKVFQAMDFSSLDGNVPTEMYVFAYRNRMDPSQGTVHLCFVRPDGHEQYYEVDADTWNEVRKITATPDTNTGKD